MSSSDCQCMVLFASGDGDVSGCQAVHLVSVGATTGTLPEIATSLSAGRFSRCFGTPSYEASAVTAYHKAFSAGLFDDVNRRGYSDVSIREVKLKIVVDGSAGTVDGECPAFARARSGC